LFFQNFQNIKKEQTMPSGGPRPNSGRPKGSKNAKTKALAKITLAAAEAGELPVDFLLRCMRDESLPAAVRMDCAKAVAPYCSPRLAAAVIATAKDESLQPVIYITRFGADRADAVPYKPPVRTIEHRD
jgi:hypothetical protein